MALRPTKDPPLLPNWVIYTGCYLHRVEELILTFCGDREQMGFRAQSTVYK